MKTTMKLLALAWTAVGISGCISSQETTITLLGIESSTALNQPPVFVTENPKAGRFEVSGGFSYTAAHEYTGNLSKPSSTLPSQPNETFAPGVGNVQWNPAQGMALFNLQYMFSTAFALTGGFHYAWGNSADGWGGNIGLALMTSTSGSAFRLDAGIQIKEVRYDALTMVQTRTTSIFGDVTEQTGIFLDNGHSTAADFYASMTFNTSNPGSFADFLLNLAVSHQTLANFSPQDQVFVTPFTGVVSVEDQRTDLNATFFLVTPGVMFRAGEQQRILVGARMATNFASNELESKITWIPFIQLNFILSPGSD